MMEVCSDCGKENHSHKMIAKKQFNRYVVVLTNMCDGCYAQLKILAGL